MDEKNRKPQVDTAGAAGTPAAEKDAPLTEQKSELWQLAEKAAALSPQLFSRYLAYLDTLAGGQDTPQPF